MFIYSGKLQWLRYGAGELLVVVLPNGPVRVGDTVYLSSQWTVDGSGFKKQKWFSAQTVQKVVKANNGDDTFILHGGYYLYEISSQQGYKTINITMSNPGGAKDHMTLERVYQSKGEVAAQSARIWTGKLDWPQTASDEPFTAIVPEGLGDGKPVLAFWQWTVDANLNPKVECIAQGTQTAETPANDKIKFSFSDHYSLDCTWDVKTEELAVHMQETGKHEQDIGPFKLAALIEFHSEDFTPPDIPLEKQTFDVRYPQTEPALPRIQAPLPFPRTLLETLSHTAAYVDQAGYLAKYAVGRYHTLDQAYHSLLKQVDELTNQIRELSGKVNELTTVNEAEKHEIESLQKKLSDALDAAAKREAELTKQIQDLQKALAKEQAHDEEDHKALDEAHKQLQEANSRIALLQKQVLALQLALGESNSTITQLQAQVTNLNKVICELRGELEAEKKHNADLSRENGDLKNRVASAERETAAVKKTLEQTTEDLKKTKADNDEKDKIISGLEEGIVAVKKDRDAKQAAYDELKKSTDIIIKELQDEIAKLKRGGGHCWPWPTDGPFDPPFKNIPPFKDTGSSPMDEKWWKNMGMDESMARRLGLEK
ncbi:unnamed protein product [Clonostachys rosea]|uniref:Uncharacterized protein n=1 Tax=Bionectria ochroleuca TaxID=29856 RepID=A0ABY6UNI2_BIOOC|nr:unnamed protein product [Clonostachys rosea]